MARVKGIKHEELEAFWRAHHDAWRRSALNQREYCELNGLPLKRFGNWRSQFRKDDPPRRARFLHRRGGLGHMPSHMSSPMAREIIVAPAGYLPPGPEPGPERGPGASPGRRSFSEADKRRIVAESAAPGATISGVARQHGITVRLLFRWRQELEGRGAPEAQFLSVAVEDPAEPSAEAGTVPSSEAASVSASGPARGPAPVIVERTAPGIEVELVGGRRLRFARDIDPETVCRLVALLEGEPR